MLLYGTQIDPDKPFTTIDIRSDNETQLNQLMDKIKGKCIKIDRVSIPPEFWGDYQVAFEYTEQVTIKVANQKLNEIVNLIEESNKALY